MPQDPPEDRVELAVDRTIFAAERTYAAWVRTGLAGLVSGVGAQNLLDEVLHPNLVLVGGSLLILFGIFCFGAAVWRHVHPGVAGAPAVARLPRSLLIGANAALVLVSLVALVGIWISI